MAFPTTSVLDRFVDPSAPRDLDIYSGNWSVSAGIDSGSIPRTAVGSQAQNDGAGGSNHAYWNGLPNLGDCETYMDWPVIGIQVFLNMRMNTSGNNRYAVAFGAGSFEIAKFIPGFTSLLSASHTFVAGCGVGFSVSGSELTVFHRNGGPSIGWDAIGSVVDGDLTSGYIGFGVNGNAARITNFGGGAISGDIGSFPTAKIRSRRTSW